MSEILTTIILLPILGAILCLFISSSKTFFLQKIALYSTLLTFFISIFLWLGYDPFQMNFQAISNLNISIFPLSQIMLGIDSISLLFIVLTTFLFPFCILVNWNQINTNVKEYLIFFLFLEALLISVFSFLDVIFFYIFFESVLIPMFLFIGIWGSRERKIYASYLLFLYTLIGSLLMLIGVLYLSYVTGSTDFYYLSSISLDSTSQNILWVAFFASFSVKIPMFPFHIWLPEAHVEAPTAGSVLLAGILLKLGGYGFLRFSLTLFPEATLFFKPLVFTLATVAIIYTSLSTLRQVDIKKIVAYSSIAHMNLVVLGLFSNNIIALQGAIFLMLSHGVVSGGLFLAIGNIYSSYKTRLIKYYGGLVQLMPLFSFTFFVLSFANLSLPGTSSFVGEFLILLGLFYNNYISALIAGITVILGAAYSLWLLNRLIFGNIQLSYISMFKDISKKDFFIYAPLIIFIIVAGIYPNMIISMLDSDVSAILFSYK